MWVPCEALCTIFTRQYIGFLSIHIATCDSCCVTS